MAANPQFINTPRIAMANTATANTAIDGTGTITEVIAGATGGTRVLELVVKLAETSAAAQVNVFLTTDGGTTWYCFDSITVTAATVSNSVASNRTSRAYSNIVLASSAHRIGFTTTIAQSTNVIAFGGDLS
jgi:hypothetical protein